MDFWLCFTSVGFIFRPIPKCWPPCSTTVFADFAGDCAVADKIYHLQQHVGQRFGQHSGNHPS